MHDTWGFGYVKWQQTSFEPQTNNDLSYCDEEYKLK